jgi:glutathione S-transferase
MTTPRYTLYYFDIRGRAEPIRLLLHHAGIAFEDRGLAGDVWRAEHKAGSPLGQMPFLVENDTGRRIPQNLAILRHLARRHELAGRTADEMLAADVAADTVGDLRAEISKVRFSPAWKDPEARAKLGTDTAPTHLARLAKLLGERAFFAADAPTWADLFVFDVLESIEAGWPDALAAQPTLGAFVARVRALPTLQAYLGSRRPSDMTR